MEVWRNTTSARIVKIIAAKIQMCCPSGSFSNAWALLTPGRGGSFRPSPYSITSLFRSLILPGRARVCGLWVHRGSRLNPTGILCFRCNGSLCLGCPGILCFRRTGILCLGRTRILRLRCTGICCRCRTGIHRVPIRRTRFGETHRADQKSQHGHQDYNYLHRPHRFPSFWIAYGNPLLEYTRTPPGKQFTSSSGICKPRNQFLRIYSRSNNHRGVIWIA